MPPIKIHGPGDEWTDEDQAELRQYLLDKLADTINRCELQLGVIRERGRRMAVAQMRQEMIDLYDEVWRSGRKRRKPRPKPGPPE